MVPSVLLASLVNSRVNSHPVECRNCLSRKSYRRAGIPASVELKNTGRRVVGHPYRFLLRKRPIYSSNWPSVVVNTAVVRVNPVSIRIICEYRANASGRVPVVISRNPKYILL